MQQLADTRSTVRISHHYAVSPARVFDAWLTPPLAGLWLFATASRPMANVAIDARSGGTFCLVERRAGTRIEHRGRYVEIVHAQRLVFTLHSPDCAPKEVLLGGATDATRVSVTFTPRDTGCKLRLMHDGLSANGVARMEARWTGMLYGLGVVLTQ
jgi:uncharacterized protein YndB with AHSA1/START domain